MCVRGGMDHTDVAGRCVGGRVRVFVCRGGWWTMLVPLVGEGDV